MKLDSHIRERLQRCSKDEVAQAKLETLFSQIISKYEEVSNQLAMLERAISYDYDSILITDLGLEDPGPKIVYVNDGFTRMTGYTKEEVIGKTPRILQGPKTERMVLDRLKKGLSEGQGFFGHTINYRKDGSEFIAQWDIHPLTNAQGEITHWVSYQRDITEREKINKKIAEASLEFEDLEEDLKRTLLEIDRHGNIIDSNHAFRETIEYDSETLTDFRLWDLVVPEDVMRVKEACKNADEHIRRQDALTWVFKTGKDNEVILKARFRPGEENRGSRIKICFENVSLRNKLIEALKEKTLSLEETMHRDNEFTLKFKKEGDRVKCSFASDNFVKITGHQPRQVVENNVDLILDEKRKDAFFRHLEKAFEGTPTTVDCVYKKKDGSLLPIIQAFRPVWNEAHTAVEAVKTVAVLKLKESSGADDE